MCHIYGERHNNCIVGKKMKDNSFIYKFELRMDMGISCSWRSRSMEVDIKPGLADYYRWIEKYNQD